MKTQRNHQLTESTTHCHACTGSFADEEMYVINREAYCPRCAQGISGQLTELEHLTDYRQRIDKKRFPFALRVAGTLVSIYLVVTSIPKILAYLAIMLTPYMAGEAYHEIVVPADSQHTYDAQYITKLLQGFSQSELYEQLDVKDSAIIDIYMDEVEGQTEQQWLVRFSFATDQISFEHAQGLATEHASLFKQYLIENATGEALQ